MDPTDSEDFLSQFSGSEITLYIIQIVFQIGLHLGIDKLSYLMNGLHKTTSLTLNEKTTALYT